jgi:hypothetical protein
MNKPKKKNPRYLRKTKKKKEVKEVNIFDVLTIQE